MRGVGLLIVLLAGPPSAVWGAVELQVGSATGPAGSAVSVPISLAADVPILALQFDLTFVAGISVDNAALVDPGLNVVVSSRDIQPRSRRVIVYSPTSKPLPPGTLAAVSFQIAAGTPAGTIPILLQNVIASDSSFHRAAGLTTRSGAVIVGGPAGARFTSVLFDQGVLRLELSASSGRTHIIQSSTDLQAWTAVGTNVPVEGILRFSEPAGPGSYRFYRALLPPPGGSAATP